MYLYERMLLVNFVTWLLFNHVTLVVPFLKSSPPPIPPKYPIDKLKVRISWDASPACDLLPIFLSTSDQFNCDLKAEDPDFDLEYQFQEGPLTESWREIEFDSALNSLINMKKQSREIRLFEYEPISQSIRFVDSDCFGTYSNESECFSQLDSNVKYLVRIVNNYEINLFFKNENFDYEINKKDTLVFNREPFDDPFLNYYHDQYVEINFENGSDFRLNLSNDSVEFWCAEMAGQVVEVRFVAEWSVHFNLFLDKLIDKIGFEINQTIFTMSDYQSNFFDHYVEFDANLKPYSIRTLSNPFIIEIPFKNRIVNITKLSLNKLRVDWTRPLGQFDSIQLECQAEDFTAKVNYNKDSLFGHCVHPEAFSGQLFQVFMYVKHNDNFYRTDKAFKLIEPEAVENVKFDKSLDYVTISWNMPKGSFTYFNVSCLDLKTNIVVDRESFLNHSGAKCQNLQSNTEYQIEITTVVEKSNSISTNRTVTTYSTNNLSSLTLDELSVVNFTDYSSVEIGDMINTLQKNFTMIKDQDALKSYIDSCSVIVENVAFRQTSTESLDIVIWPFWNLIDQFMDSSDQIFKSSVQTSNKLSKSLEIISNKINFEPLTTKFYLNTTFNNFFVKSTIIQDNSQNSSNIGFLSNTNQEISSINANSIDELLKNDKLKYAAYFNKDAIENMVSGNKTPRITFLGYTATKLFNGKAKNLDDLEVDCNSTLQIGPNVVSASKIPGIEPKEDLLTLIYEQQLNEKFCDKRKVKHRLECVFWDYDLSDWNPDGCQYVKIDTDDKVFHKCTCNHTTNFALLMVVDSVQFCDWCEIVLFYVSIIGICTSIIGLIATIVYDIAISILPSRKSVKKTGMLERYSQMSKEYLKVITAWCFSLLVMNSVYIAFSFFKFDEADITESQRASCIAIGVLLHYFLLSSFCFSFCITLVQLIIIYKSFKVFKFILLKSLAFSFGVPIIPVAIVIGISRDAYINPNNYCWLHSLFAIFGALVPIAIILLINLVLFIMIGLSHSNIIRKRNKYLHKKENIDEKGAKQEIMLILTCFVNTGLTWLFGFLVTLPAEGDWIYARFVYGLIFCLLNTTQGFQIFFTYFIISKRRRKVLEEKLKIQLELIKKKLRNQNNKISCT